MHVVILLGRYVSSDTVGVMLLVKMGWKPGQGIGPRLSRMEKKRQKRRGQPNAAKKVYGCRLPTEDSASATDNDSQASGSEPEIDGDFDNVTFAPNDYQAYVVSPKQNAFGLGYQGIDRKPVLTSERSELSVLTVAGKSIRGQVNIYERGCTCVPYLPTLGARSRSNVRFLILL